VPGLVFMLFRPDPFSAIPWASGIVFMLALPSSFSVILRASGLVFMFGVTGLIFDGIEGVRSRFHVFRSLTCFRRCEGRRVPFSCFLLPDMFSAVSRASDPIFMFCTP
jgi:hypothetical protein